jgi:hypothetical protein
VNGGVILAQAFVKNIVATYIGRQTGCHGDILNPPSPGLMRRENNSVMSSTKNEAVVNHVKAQKLNGRRSSQSLDFLFGSRVQIRSSNLLDQILDFGGIGSWGLVPFGHGWSLTFSSGMSPCTDHVPFGPSLSASLACCE